MSLDFTDDQSTLLQVMAWCRQATSHYLSQCWPWSLSPYGVTRPQWVNSLLDMGVLTIHRHGATFTLDFMMHFDAWFPCDNQALGYNIDQILNSSYHTLKHTLWVLIVDFAISLVWGRIEAGNDTDQIDEYFIELTWRHLVLLKFQYAMLAGQLMLVRVE